MTKKDKFLHCQSRLFRNFAFFILLVFASDTFAQQPSQTRILLRNLNLIEGKGGAVKTNTDILIDRQRITAIGRNLKSAGARVIDLLGKTVMPAMISSPSYQKEQKASAAAVRSAAAFRIVLQNVKKLYNAGVLLALGTDSGVFPIRAQGFAEHLELELLVEAGLSPLENIQNTRKVYAVDKAGREISKVPLNF